MTKEFWKAALVRAIRTFAEAMLAYIGTGALVLKDVNWLAALSAGAMGFIVAILLALTGLPEVAGSSVTKQTDKPPDEESCPVTVKAYDDYYDNGSP